MFRTIARKFLPNPLDWMLKRTAKRGGKRVLIAWNRGLGDIALGLYAMTIRVREFIPDAKIVFLTRENLKDGFTLLEGVETIVAPFWKRGETIEVKQTLRRLGIDPEGFDLIIQKPSPTDWVRWQRGKVVPRLKWNSDYDALWKKFDLDGPYLFVGVQAVAETTYGLWRNWPVELWQELFTRLEKRGNVRILLFGYGDVPRFSHSNLVDLRGKTSLFELLSIIKNRCHSLVLPDSGVLSMAYYLDAPFPIRVVSLWGDPNHGILKQAVASPNPQLIHVPLIGGLRDLSTVSAEQVDRALFPRRPLQKCKRIEEIEKKPVQNGGCIILAGGQGTRLGFNGPKGLFPVGGKTLFQWICEKVEDKRLPLAVMTSPLNHEETIAFFKSHSFFGLDVHFFQQEMRPLLNEKKEPIERKPGELLLGPNGNGSLYRSFVNSGLADLFRKKDIDAISIIPVENPLANPFDGRMFAYHRSEKNDVTIKCVERTEADLSMGVLVENGENIEVAEYTGLSPLEMTARGEDGLLKYRFGNIGQIVLDLSFMIRMASVDLPLHWVKKKMPIEGHVVPVWKGEHYLFDAFAFADRVRALCDIREICYAPLKDLNHLKAVENAVIR